MPARRITVDPRTVQTPRFGHLRVLQAEVIDDTVLAAAPDEGSGAPERVIDALVLRASRAAPTGGRVLDLGTGAAAIAIGLARRRPDLRVVGIDASEAMVERARERTRESGVQRRVRIRRSGARRLPFRRRSFDLVVSHGLLHRLPDPLPTFDEIARILAPRGRVLLQDLRRPGPSRRAAVGRRHGRRLRGGARRRFLESLRAAFKVAEVRQMIGLSRLRGCRVRARAEIWLVVDGRPVRRRRRARG